MRLVRFIRSRPVWVLGLLALVFVAWVWRDALRPLPLVAEAPNSSPIVISMSPEFAEGPVLNRRLPAPPEAEKSRPSPRETAQVLPKLKPGMTRAEVEVLVGVPFAEDIHPATISDGRVTYHMAYEADLAPPSTIRPIRPHRPLPRAFEPKPRDRTVVTLEFDATKPGHPLLGIHYPDPLF